MTVTVQNSKTTFTGNGSTGPFQFSFVFYANSWIYVTLNDPVLGSVLLTENVDYYLTGANNPTGGSLTLVNALTSLQTLTVNRIIPLVQSVALANFGAFFAQTHEQVFDTLTMMIQQVNDLANTSRFVASGITSTATTLTANAALGPVNVDINGLAEVYVSKSDTSINPVNIIDSSGMSICRGGLGALTIQDETVHLKLIGTNWVKL